MRACVSASVCLSCNPRTQLSDAPLLPAPQSHFPLLLAFLLLFHKTFNNLLCVSNGNGAGLCARERKLFTPPPRVHNPMTNHLLFSITDFFLVRLSLTLSLSLSLSHHVFGRLPLLPGQLLSTICLLSFLDPTLHVLFYATRPFHSPPLTTVCLFRLIIFRQTMAKQCLVNILGEIIFPLFASFFRFQLNLVITFCGC